MAEIEGKKSANLKIRQQKLPNINKQKEKDQNQNELSHKYQWNYNKSLKICVTGSPPEGEQKEGLTIQIIQKNLMNGNIPNWAKHLNIKIQGS